MDPSRSMETKRRTQSSSGALPASGSRVLAKDRYRIVVMGGSGVGKTCIISRLMYEQFLSEYKATVEDLHSGQYELNGVPLTLDILDTSGTHEFPGMRRLSIATGDAFLLVYSVDDESTFDEVERIRQQILDVKADESTPIVIVGNKTDVGDHRRRVPLPTAEAMASVDWGLGYVEVSAKDDVNIGDIFKELLAQVNLHMEQMLTVSSTEGSTTRFSFRRNSKKTSSARSKRRPTSCQVS